MLKRRYGDKEEELSILGFGGIMVSKVETAEAEQLVGRGIDCGINYFDVAPSYGNAEEMLGPALKPYRDEVFLACKTTDRSAAGARRELESSLVNMRTGHFDLYQLHAMTTMEDFDQATGPGGALETFVKAREEFDVCTFTGCRARCRSSISDSSRRPSPRPRGGGGRRSGDR